MAPAQYPILDLHCDLLSYLDTLPGSTVHDVDAIGCALPHLRAGHVRVQVMAVFALTGAGSAACGARQISTYLGWKDAGLGLIPLQAGHTESDILAADAIHTLLAIENASCFAEEDEPLSQAFARLEAIIAAAKPLYITITHHAENRFGGGNFTDVGLKPDGRALLDFLSGRRIAVDLSHTCDRFAREILDHIDAKGLDIRVLASHSNFRPVWNHSRNLPDWLSREIIDRGGIVGINFIRDFVNPNDPKALLAHIRYGQQLGARLSWAADYFSPLTMPPQYAFREPYFHPEHRNAACFPAIMAELESANVDGLAALSWQNGWEWIKAGW